MDKCKIPQKILAQLNNISKIGEGGQKTVYKAYHDKYGQIVVKISKYISSRELKRIEREVKILKKIDSKYFPKNYDLIFCDEEKIFIIFEQFIEGKVLKNVMNRYNDENSIISLFKELIMGLSIIWKKRIVHRDLKPNNIIITKNNKPCIIDLGIARILDMKSLTGTDSARSPCTPPYASPEQLLNKKEIINHRSDFYSLGIIILELSLGFHPFLPEKVGNDRSITENIIKSKFVDPSIKEGASDEFIILIRRLLAKEPYKRFRNVDILADYIYNNWS